MPKYWVPCKCLDAKIGFFWIYSWDCFEMTFNLIDKKKPAQNNSEAISWNVASSDGEKNFKEQMAENVLNHKYISPPSSLFRWGVMLFPDCCYPTMGNWFASWYMTHQIGLALNPLPPQLLKSLQTLTFYNHFFGRFASNQLEFQE